MRFGLFITRFFPSSLTSTLSSDSSVHVMRLLMACDPGEYDQQLRDSLVDYNLCYDSVGLATFRHTLEVPLAATPFNEHVLLCIELLVSAMGCMRFRREL